MRPAALAPLLLTLAAATVIAQQPTLQNTPDDISLGDNPPCALPCLSSGLNQTQCASNDQACLCADQEYIGYVQGCVAMSCPLKFTLQTLNTTWTVCDFPLHDEAKKTKVARLVLFAVLPTLSMILRIITKFAHLSAWGWDDYSIILAYVLLVGWVGLHFHLEDNGAGKDLWTLTDDQITNFFKIFYVLQVLYHSCIDVIKASILFMYLRIFHLPDEKIRMVLWGTQVLNLLNGLIFIFVGLFQCTPISLAWTFWTGEATGKCIDITQLALAHAGINIVLDVWMLILPATQIWGMNLALRKKLAIMFMFSLGLFLTIVSVVRVTAILEYKKSPLNPTVGTMPSILWSDIELFVGIFTACIPNLRQFFVRYVLRQSERKKRLDSAAAERNSNFTPKRSNATTTQQLSELDTVDDGLDDSNWSPETSPARTDKGAC